MNGYDRIYSVVSEIPEGKVATYGQIAQLVGRPRSARRVGYALAATPDDLQIPWHRVINASGEISVRSEPGGDELQRTLLEGEGVLFDEQDRVSLAHFRWRPEATPAQVLPAAAPRPASMRSSDKASAGSASPPS